MTILVEERLNEYIGEVIGIFDKHIRERENRMNKFRLARERVAAARAANSKISAEDAIAQICAQMHISRPRFTEWLWNWATSTPGLTPNSTNTNTASTPTTPAFTGTPTGFTGKGNGRP